MEHGGGVRLRTGYDGKGQVSVHNVVARGCVAMLARPETAAA